MEPIQIEISKDPRRIDGVGPILVAHQPEFLPWLGNISKATMGDVYFLLDTVQFVKEHWQNKNKIRIKNVQGWQWLIIPVSDAKKHFYDTCAVKIAKGNWKKKHLRAIEYSYAKAPFFKDIFREIEELYEADVENLSDFLVSIIKYAFNKFDIRVPVYRTSELIKKGFLLEGQKSSLIINMCKAVAAKTFVFGHDGRTYIDKDVFIKNNINFVFQEYAHPVYKQIHGDFVSHMSFLDLLFNYGPDAVEVLGKSNYLGE